ncbi:MAG TPA: S8 family serine peptidase, partial [Solirubrobacteraceae bacterium]|nr:S8 family serine peptidase [Solirubrobacteraceae bacterium]
MKRLLRSSAAKARKRFSIRTYGAIVAAIALGVIAPGSSAAAEPLSGEPTSPLAAISSPGAVPGRYIVTFSADASAATQRSSIAEVGATDVSAIPALRMHVVDASEEAAASLRADGLVTSVEADQARDVQGANDPEYSSQWSLPRIGWDQVFGSVNPSGTATVAVLDTGVDATHPDLAGQVIPGASFVNPGSDGTEDPNGHGTWMAGIVAAGTGNSTGIAGIGYAGVKVMPVTVLGADGSGSDGDIINGVVYAADHGASVILMSFTSAYFSRALQEAIDYAWSKDVVVVAAAGNDESPTVNYPAGDRGVVGVANSDEEDLLNASSNFGDDVFMAAPGTGIDTTAVGGGYAAITGTSAAAAEVAGSAALLRADAPGASNGVIVGRLAANADPLNGGEQAGNGRLDLARAIQDASTHPIEPAGAAPVGEGGPVVGPYVVAAKKIKVTIVGNG